MEELIEEVRKYPCLYDTRTEEYKDLQRKDSCWTLIAQSLHRDCKSLKQDWKKLRDCFRQAQARRNTSGQSTKNWKPWRYEKQMQFLIPFMSSREINANMESIDRDGMDYSEEIPATTAGDIQEGVPASRTTSKDGDTCSHKKRRSTTTCDFDKVITCLHEEQPMSNTQDDLYLFFMSACQSTRQLPRRLQNQVKRDVLDCIARAEEQYDDECKNNPSVSRRISSESSLPYGTHIAILKTEM